MNNNDTTRMAERILSEDTYFERRTTLDRGEARKAFRDGFDRGWKAATCKESVQRFLKDGETVEQCLVRNRRDIDILLGLLAKEREKSDIVRPYESPRWRDVADELPQEAQEVLFVRGGKTVHGAWIGGIFWHSNQKMAAAQWMPLPEPPKVGADSTAEPNCDRSACGDFSHGPCDHPDCPAIGKTPDDMIAMENAQGKKFALKLNPTHPQHGWIFYDNHGQWVTLRRALPHEIERAKGILEMRQVLAGIPCKA